MKRPIILLILLSIVSCSEKNPTTGHQNTVFVSANSKEVQEEIITEHLRKGAWKHDLYSREWQAEIDKGLAKDSTIAMLWQQKAMPLFKQGKYELGMEYIDKAVRYDRRQWQDYRAFIKCIFANTYRDAIADFEDCKARFGYDYVMEHSYDFYIALCKLQLNEFSEAEEILVREVDMQVKEKGEDWLNPMDLFYLGIAKFEQGKYEEAGTAFDRALKLYPKFSEAMYYRAMCHDKLGNQDMRNTMRREAIRLGKQGYTITDDNVVYERYPYQIVWQLE